jgi:pyridoxamine 5'-phosphate oxidase
MASIALLPEPLPENPLGLFGEWFQQARTLKVQPNPDAMVVATVGEHNTPSARVVLCKGLNVDEGYAVFFTNYHSRKGRELSQHARAAAVFHWDSLSRQVRIEGPVVASPSAESDAYFASRALDSRLGAWASRQSEPLDCRATLVASVQETAAKFGVAPGATQAEVPRPSHWGGFRLWIESLELWTEGPHRVHDRALWRRSLQRYDGHRFKAGAWSATRLNP